MAFLNLILAQVAAAAPENVTIGSILTAIMFIMTSAGSMLMIVVWVIRFGQTGHALPAARRGVLRVPWPLTMIAILLSVLVMVFALLSSLAELIPGGNKVATQAVTDTGSGDTDTVDTPAAGGEAAPDTDGEDATAPTKTPNASPVQVQENLILTIGMELIMLLGFGAVILAASKAGRVDLPEPLVQLRQALSRSVSVTGQLGREVVGGMGFGSPWPDLDDASSIPQLPGYDILGNLGRNNPGQNPFAVELTNEPFETGQNSPVPVTVEPRIADERFSFFQELRFALEVFLAAYLPTTALRLLIVLISIGIVGEPPKSHPFLEMLEAGVSVSMIAIIVLVAVFVAPIVEELQFRVVVLGGIAQIGQPRLALIASSILFAFAHEFPDSIALIPLALALGYAYLRRRSYVTVMLVHFLFNGFNMILALVSLL